VALVLALLAALIPIYDARGQGSALPANDTPLNPPSELERKLERIEDRQALLVEAAQNDLGRVYFIFSAVAAFFGLFMVFGAIRGLVDDRRRGRLEQQHMQHLQGMMAAFGDNVAKINSFISTLTGTFSVQEDLAARMKKLDDRLQTLDHERQQQQVSFRSQIDSLNTACADAFRTCGLHRRDREAFKKEENRILLQSLCARMDTLSLTGDTTGIVSPVAHFIRGLARFNEMKYQDAVDDIRASRDLAKQQVSSPLSQFGGWDADEVQRNLRILLDESHYHLGIIFYNSGSWDDARQEFALAFERFDLDFRSRIYIPELMFFDDSCDPRRTEQEFLAVLEELNNVTSDRRKNMEPTWDACLASLRLRQGNIYLKKLFLPASRSDQWSVLTREEGNAKALDCYWEAWDASGGGASHVVAFSLAQAMEYAGPGARWKDYKPRDIFRDAFFKFRNQAILKTEPILLTLLYYCTAICCHYGDIAGDSPSSYLGLARQQIQRVPETILVFSPISKLMVTHSDLLAEMDEIEQIWQEQIRRRT
jgi:tetratricopeptide (TPR) repeat protein